MRFACTARLFRNVYANRSSYALDALCTVAVDQGADAAPLWTDRFAQVAARRGIRELFVFGLGGGREE